MGYSRKNNPPPTVGGNSRGREGGFGHENPGGRGDLAFQEIREEVGGGSKRLAIRWGGGVVCGFFLE